MPLLIVGTVAFDSIKTPHGEVTEVLGGSAAHAAVAASYFTPVRLMSVVGTDFGDAPMTALRARGIDLGGLKRLRGKTFRWSGRYTEDLNHRTTLATHLNVFEKFDPRVRKENVGISHLFLGNIDPAVQWRILNDTKPGFACCDTMNFWIDRKGESIKRLLAAVDGLLVNDSEVRLLAGEPHMIAASRRLLDLGLRFLVVKRGEYGAALFVDDTCFAIPAYPVEKPVDPTGAGDCFAGGFIGHLARTGATDARNLREAMLYGSAVASFCVEDFGLRRFDSVEESNIEQRYADLRRFINLDG